MSGTKNGYLMVCCFVKRHQLLVSHTVHWTTGNIVQKSNFINCYAQVVLEFSKPFLSCDKNISICAHNCSVFDIHLYLFCSILFHFCGMWFPTNDNNKLNHKHFNKHFHFSRLIEMFEWWTQGFFKLKKKLALSEKKNKIFFPLDVACIHRNSIAMTHSVQKSQFHLFGIKNKIHKNAGCLSTTSD